jgi:ABC-type nitrate/sulfonate/bicarbonate transport system permease component
MATGLAGAAPLPGRAVLRIAGAARAVAERSLSIVLFLLVWEGVARSGLVTPFQLPSLLSVFARIGADVASGEALTNTALTLYRALAGFALAAVGGVVLGMLMFRSALARWFFDPLISAGFPMPKIAFLPIVILWFGVYDMPKITMIVIDAIFPVVTATVLGFQGVDRHLLWSARNMGAGERELLWQIMLPAALPQILTGLQVALPIALIIAIATEMLMGGRGLGGAMLEASRMADSPGAFAGLVEMTVLGYFAIKSMAMIRRRLLRWHQETQHPTGA